MNISTIAGSYLIEKPAQLELLASAVRQDILDSLESMGPSSVAELSRAVGLPADALYYHINKLVAVGLVLERETRPSERRDETVFGLPARRMQLRYDTADTTKSGYVKKIVSSMLRTADRDFEAGLRSKAAVTEGPSRNLWGARVKGWLSQDQLDEVGGLLDRIHAIFHSDVAEGDKTLCALTWALAPVEAQPVRRKPKNEDKHSPRRERKR